MPFRFFLIISGILLTTHCYADPKVYSPIVDKGEFAVEVRGNTTVDDDKDSGGSQRHVFELEYGVTDWWKTALISRLDRPGEGSLEYDSTAWENIFQLTEKGRYWLDAGFYLEYKLADENDTPDILETRILLEKQISAFLNTLNLNFEKEIGNNSDNALESGYAWRTKTEIGHDMGLGFEAFGELGELENIKDLKDQEHRIGPVFYHEIDLGGLVVDYNLAWLFGLTQASPDHTFRWQLEFEF